MELISIPKFEDLPKQIMHSAHYRFWSDAYETIRCEFFWPWNGEETWKGIKEGFSFILMVFGLFIIFRSLFPTVNADCCPVAVSDLGSMFSKHGKLHHPAVPPIWFGRKKIRKFWQTSQYLNKRDSICSYIFILRMYELKFQVYRLI